MTFLGIMNSFPVWLFVSLALGFVFLLCVITLRKAWANALKLGLSDTQLKSVVRSSAVFSIVPSIAIVIGLFALAGALGVPWSWFRLSVIGSVGYELVAADMAAVGAGYQSLGALVTQNDPTAVGPVMMAMSVGIIGGIVGVTFFSQAIQTGMVSFRKKYGPWGALLMSCFIMAMLAVFVPARSIYMGKVAIATFITAMLATILQRLIIQKFGIKWLGNFVMSLSLVIGMVSSVFWTQVLK